MTENIALYISVLENRLKNSHLCYEQRRNYEMDLERYNKDYQEMLTQKEALECLVIVRRLFGQNWKAELAKWEGVSEEL